MTNDEINTLIDKWQRDKCTLSRNTIVNGCINLIYKSAYKYCGCNDVQDYAQEAAIALIDACNTYNSQHMAFVPYATTIIKYRLIDYIRSSKLIPLSNKGGGKYDLSQFPQPRKHSEIKALAQQRNLSYKHVLKYALAGANSQEIATPINNITPEQLVEQEQDIKRLQQAVALLRPDLKDVIRKYYYEDKFYTQIGKEMGFSKQYAHVKFQEAHRELRKNIC